MKRKTTFLTSIFIIAMMLFTSSVFAVETFTHEGSTYVIEEIKLKLDSLGTGIYFIGMDKDNNYVIADNYDKLYKVNENECTLMSNQEILDFMNNSYDIHNYVEDDLNIYQEKSPYYGGMMEYIITDDKMVDSNKEYYQKIEHEWNGQISYSYEPVENPDLENGTYLELAFLVVLKNATIDENITYYKEVEGIYTKVENPKTEEVCEYRVIGNPDEYHSITKIGKITQEVYDKIITVPEQNVFAYEIRIVEDEENNDLYFIAEYSYPDSEKSIIYKEDGTVIKEYGERMTIMPIGNKFFAIAPIKDDGITDDSKMVIIDKEGNTVLENTEIPYLRTIKYDKYTTYLKHYEDGFNKYYNMYEYKLLSENDQKYEGKDLTVKTSGELDRLISVKVNGVELDTANYTKTSGSTIVTLKNDYLKTLELGTYTLTLGYKDGTTIETKFVVDQIFSNDNENEGNKENTSNEENSEGPTEETPGGTIEEDKNKGDKDNTPQTGNTRAESVLGMYITMAIAIVGIVVTRKK